MGEEISIPKCKFIDCDDECCKYLKQEIFRNYCAFHDEGGIFGTGESYEQYQIIENDFINFIKVVPLKDHFNVYSPVLRDIIIRTCVQIEIFFKEWAKEKCTNNPGIGLLVKYNEKYKDGTVKGVKNWSIKDYFIFMDEINRPFSTKIYVLPLNEEINPFEDWKIDKPMFWWGIYNEIKHSGHKAKNKATLQTALYSLAGLFQLHCLQRSSLNYLKGLSSIYVSENFQKLVISKLDITTPVDSKRYLFKALNTGGKSYEIVTDDSLKKFSKNKGRL